MSNIYIYSPSGATRDKAAFKRGVQRLKKAGYSVVLDDAALLSEQRFAGDDAMRLAAIGRASVAQADMTLIARGGYGLSRILPQIDYEAISASIARGTQWMGFSDFTALQLALLAKQGVGPNSITWAGLSLGDDVACIPREGAEPDDITMACFDDVLQGIAEGAGWRMSAAQAQSCGEVAIEDAPLWGGNLAMVCSLLGTPYFPNYQSQRGVKNGILFLEDTGEAPYKIERMLAQLLHAGVLQSQRAIVLGAFSHYKLTPHDKGFNLKSVVAWLREHVAVPIVEGLPFGHVETKVCLPVGARVSLQVQERDAFILWESV